MEDKTYMIPPIGGKSILRSTGEEVEVIDSQIKERGARTDEDLVTYIDSNGNDHYEITDSDITAGTISKNWSKPGFSVAKSYIKLFVRGEYGTAVKRILYKDE